MYITPIIEQSEVERRNRIEFESGSIQAPARTRTKIYYTLCSNHSRSLKATAKQRQQQWIWLRNLPPHQGGNHKQRKRQWVLEKFTTTPGQQPQAEKATVGFWEASTRPSKWERPRQKWAHASIVKPYSLQFFFPWNCTLVVHPCCKHCKASF